MIAPEKYTFLDPSRYRDLQGDGGPVVAGEGEEKKYKTVDYIRRDLTHTDADLERAVRAALEAAERIALEYNKKALLRVDNDPDDADRHEECACTSGSIAAAIRAIDFAAIVASVKRGEGE